MLSRQLSFLLRCTGTCQLYFQQVHICQQLLCTDVMKVLCVDTLAGDSTILVFIMAEHIAHSMPFGYTFSAYTGTLTKTMHTYIYVRMYQSRCVLFTLATSTMSSGLQFTSGVARQQCYFIWCTLHMSALSQLHMVGTDTARNGLWIFIHTLSGSSVVGIVLTHEIATILQGPGVGA